MMEMITVPISEITFAEWYQEVMVTISEGFCPVHKILLAIRPGVPGGFCRHCSTYGAVWALSKEFEGASVTYTFWKYGA